MLYTKQIVFHYLIEMGLFTLHNWRVSCALDLLKLQLCINSRLPFFQSLCVQCKYTVVNDWNDCHLRFFKNTKF